MPLAAAAVFLLGVLVGADAPNEDALDAGSGHIMGHGRHMLQNPSGSVADVARGAMPKISGGQDALCGRFPYMASLRDPSNVHKCGAMLVDSRWVLTAAHCVDPATSPLGSSPIVVVGACDLDDVEVNGIPVEASVAREAFIHPNWTGSVTGGSDIALLELQVPSVHTPVELPSRLDVGRELGSLVALGWGEDEDGSRPIRLQQASGIQVLPDNICSDVWGDIVTESMVCAFGVGFRRDTCRGDSGGPLVQAFAPGGNISAGEAQLDIVVGITSFGEDNKACGNATLPSVYTAVSFFREWIDTMLIPRGISTAAAPAPAPKEVAGLSNPPSQPLAPTFGPPSPGPVPPVPSPQDHVSPPSILPDPPIEPGTTPTAPGPSPLAPSPAIDVSGLNGDELDRVLWVAARDGDLATVEAALREGADIEVRLGCCGSTPLILAAAGGSSSIVSELLAAGADVDAANDRDGITATYMASAFGHLEVVGLLIDAGADVQRSTNAGFSPLHVASSGGYADVATALLAAGADLDAQTGEGDTALAAASRRGHSAVVRVLLAINNGTDSNESTDPNGAADPNVSNNMGLSPLHFASATLGPASEEIARNLVEAGGEVDARSEAGSTPLMWAAQLGNVGTAEVLVAAGADVGARSAEGSTAEDQICLCLQGSYVVKGVKCQLGGCDERGTAEALSELLKDGG